MTLDEFIEQLRERAPEFTWALVVDVSRGQ